MQLITSIDSNFDKKELIKSVNEFEIKKVIILKESNQAHIKDMHKELHLIPREDRRNLHPSQLCHKGINDEPKHSLNRFFERISLKNHRPTRTRNIMTMKVPNLKSSKAMLGFAYRGPAHWNKLDNEHKLIKNHTTFRNAIYKIYREE